MSDKVQGFSEVKAGSTSVSLPVRLLSTAGSGVTGKVASNVTASYWRQGGTRTAISVSDLAAVNSAYSSGGLKEVDSTNLPGLYRLDIPDAAVASGADWVVIGLVVSGAVDYQVFIPLASQNAAGIATDYTSSRATKLDNLDATVGSRSSHTAANVRTEMDANSTKLANLDATVSSRSTLTAAQVWDALMTGISTAGSIGKLIKDYLDAAISSRLASSSYTAPDNTSITAIKAKTDNLPSSPAATSDIPSAATIAITVWASGTRTLSSFGTLVADVVTAVWANVNRTLTAFGFGVTVTTNNDKGGYGLATPPPTAAVIADAVWDEATADHQTAGTTGKSLSDASANGDPWAAPVRTLTTPANGTGGSADAGTFIVYRGTSWSIPITGLGDLTDRTKLYCTIKNVEGEADAEAIVQWEESAGLVRFNGAAATSSQGALTVTDANAGNITLTLKPVTSKDAAPKTYTLDIKKIVGTEAHIVGAGVLEVRPVVTRAVS